MWFGTNDGLNRYDGYNFQHFRYHPDSVSSLGLGRVNCMFIDSKGHFWTGTDQGGLNLYNIEKNNFIRFEHDIKTNNSIPGNDVRAIIENDNKELWIATFGGGISLFNFEKKVFSNYNLSDNKVYCLGYDNDGNLYVGTNDGIEIIQNARKGTQNAKTPFKLRELDHKNVISIFKDTKGFMWFGTLGDGAYFYDPGTKYLQHFSTQTWGKYCLTHNIVRSFAEDVNHTILIGTGGGGINIIGPDKHVETVVQNQLNNQFSLSSDIIYCIYRDDQNNLWLGTYDTGIDVVFDVKDKFNHIRSFGETNNLSKNSVLAIREDKNGKIWIGTDGGGLNRYDPIHNNFEHFKHNPDNLNSISGNVVKSLFFDRDGILWIGTFNEGLNAYDPKTGNFRRFYHNISNPNSLASNHIWDIDQDKNGLLWLAMLNGGLDCYNPKTNSFKHYKHIIGDSTSLSDNAVSVVEIDSKGNLWIGTEYGGISIMKKGEQGKFRNFKKTDNLTGSLSSNQICSIYEDSYGQIWIGTLGGGINAFDEKTGKFKTITEDNGLPSNLVYAFLEDKKHNLWISTNDGLTKLIRNNEMLTKPVFQNYDLSDGLQSNEFSPQSACMASSGLIYFGGINGINYFLPENLVINSHIPNIVITDFKIFNKSVDINHAGSPLEKSISVTNKIILKYTQSVITFEFASLDFVIPTKNKYKYKLDGFEKNWNDVGNQHTATYTNLNPGEYSFKVIGSNNDGIWNKKGVSLTLIIKPPYYKTWIFRVFASLLIIILAYSFYKDRLRTLEGQRKNLKLMVDERTSELLNLNKAFEVQNQEIEKQSKELFSQKEDLVKINNELGKKQSQIQLQNTELEKHRHNLEDIVNQRTSELERAKLKAEESDRLKMAFLSNMSHEIRTPMNAIIGFSSLLNDSDISEDEKQEYIRLVNVNCESLLVLIDDILDISRIEANQIEIKKDIFNFQQFINDIFINYKQIRAVNKKVDFIINSKIDPDSLIETDRHRLRQILINLLDNAVKFTLEGYIELSVIEKKAEFIISVKDTGIGIDSNSLGTIFDRFRKGNENSTKIFRGVGLGLAISKRLAELLGGKLEVESKVDEGSAFIVTLSSVVASFGYKSIQYKVSISTNPDLPDLSGKIILVVEDERDNYLYMNGLLKHRNAIILWAKDGNEAIEMNRKHKVNIILMDIKMPGMNGYEALKNIKIESPDIPVIAQTAFARIEEEQKIRDAGFDDYISKPIKPSILFEIIKKFI
jgi:signal transduction histidine kinase/ligand-binding sensor domain-containing protein/CheY-like chemotaxis protein